MKLCTRCGETKDNDSFVRGARQRDGLQAWCRDCMRSYTREHRERPGVKERRNAAARARRDPSRAKDAGLRRLYGITLLQFNTMLDAQHGRCMVCDDVLDGGKATHVDHCHDTGVVRALLCGHCNKGIGSLRDDPSLLRTAAAYLDAHSADAPAKLVK